MASPYWRLPGTLNGRVEPQNAAVPHGAWVFCLGEDSQRLPSYVLGVGDKVSVKQTFSLSSIGFVRVAMRLRTAAMPAYRVVLASGAASIRVGSLVMPGDGLVGVEITDVAALAAGGVFEADDQDRIVKLSGFANAGNNGEMNVTCVPAHSGLAVAGCVAGLDNILAVAESAPAVTIEMYGARWVLKLLIDDDPRVEYTEPAGEGWQRVTLAAHVPHLSGMHTLKLEIELQNVTS